jgi:hypothetical protein
MPWTGATGGRAARDGATLVDMSDENAETSHLLRKLADYAAAKAIIAYHENPEEALRHARRTVEEGHAIAKASQDRHDADA